MRLPEIGLGFPSASSALGILNIGVAEEEMEMDSDQRAYGIMKHDLVVVVAMAAFGGEET